jgi:hypothetical protein
MEIERHDLSLLDRGITSAVSGFIEALGMMSENLQRYRRNESMAYTEQDFQELLEDKQLHVDDAVERWRY